ncbi:DGAT2, partial [Symbiodinium necroappetens]
ARSNLDADAQHPFAGSLCSLSSVPAASAEEEEDMPQWLQWQLSLRSTSGVREWYRLRSVRRVLSLWRALAAGSSARRLVRNVCIQFRYQDPCAKPEACSYAMALDKPTRSFTGGTQAERLVGFLAASLWSLVYVIAPLYAGACVVSLLRYPFWMGSWALLSPLLLSFLTPDYVIERLGHIVLTSWPMQQVPKYFDYEEYHETLDSEVRAGSRSFIVGAHPHGIFPFTAVCAAVATQNAVDGFGAALAKEAPTAAASIVKYFPILKDVVGMFGLIDASSATLFKRLTKARGVVILYVGGIVELFSSSPKKEAVYLKQRAGFIKLALRTGADVIPVYMFGNTTVLSALTWGPLASLSRALGISVTVFWGRFGLPVPKAVPLTYVRGRPLGMPHISNPTAEDIQKWHEIYCEKLKALARRSFGALREHRRWSSARTHRISQAIDLWVDARHQSRVRRALGVWRLRGAKGALRRRGATALSAFLTATRLRRWLNGWSSLARREQSFFVPSLSARLRSQVPVAAVASGSVYAPALNGCVMGQEKPLELSDPVYRWQPEASELLTFDEAHRRIVHIKPGGFITADVIDRDRSASPPDGLNVALEHDVRSVRFSPDGLFFAFLSEKRIGCLRTMQPSLQPIWPSSKWSNKSDFEILAFFWLPGEQDASDLAVVTSQGIEVFRLSFEQRAAKSQRTFPTPVRVCWLEPSAATTLVCTGARTLQPFDFRRRNAKLPRFDLVLGRGQSIEPGDVALMTIYDCTYCIHADGSNGKVSLRNVTNLEKGTPEHDIVIDISDQDTPLGPLRLSVVDNLLIVHCLERMVASVYDIRHKDGDSVPRLVCQQGVEQTKQPSRSAWLDWDYLSGGVVLDSGAGTVHQLHLNMGAILAQFLAQAPVDVSLVLKLLLRRTGCREHVVQTLRKALAARTRSAELLQGFQVLNSAYRQVIESMSQRCSGAGVRASISLQELEAQITYQSMLSEKDMVTQVFYPHFIGSEGLEGEGFAPSAEPFNLADWHIPFEARENKDLPKESPYILSVVISYLRSLLGLQILPHKILQCFVFDLCVYFRQEHMLQQLLHYHVLLDSPELVFRLKDLARHSTKERSWATQASLDMALRVREFSVVADMLLFSSQYLDIVPFLINQKDVSFKVRTLLERLENDADATRSDPELMQHVLAEIRLWKQEATLPTSSPNTEANGTGRAVLPAPDLSGCEKWLPELLDEARSGPEAAIFDARAQSLSILVTRKCTALGCKACKVWRAAARRSISARSAAAFLEAFRTRSIIRRWAGQRKAEIYRSRRLFWAAWRGFTMESKRTKAETAVRRRGYSHTLRSAWQRWGIATVLKAREAICRQRAKTRRLGVTLRSWQSLKAAKAFAAHSTLLGSFRKWNRIVGHLFNERRARELMVGVGSWRRDGREGPTRGRLFALWTQVVQSKRMQRRRVREAKEALQKLAIVQALWFWHSRARESSMREDHLNRASIALQAMVSASRWARAHDLLIRWFVRSKATRIMCSEADLSGEAPSAISLEGSGMSEATAPRTPRQERSGEGRIFASRASSEEILTSSVCATPKCLALATAKRETPDAYTARRKLLLARDLPSRDI